MDLAKVGEVWQTQVLWHEQPTEVNQRLSGGWVLVSVRIADEKRVNVYVLGKPREKPPLTPIDTSTRDLQKFHLSSEQCEGRNEPPGQ